MVEAPGRRQGQARATGACTDRRRTRVCRHRQPASRAHHPPGQARRRPQTRRTASVGRTPGRYQPGTRAHAEIQSVAQRPRRFAAVASAVAKLGQVSTRRQRRAGRARREREQPLAHGDSARGLRHVDRRYCRGAIAGLSATHLPATFRAAPDHLSRPRRASAALGPGSLAARGRHDVARPGRLVAGRRLACHRRDPRQPPAAGRSLRPHQLRRCLPQRTQRRADVTWAGVLAAVHARRRHRPALALALLRRRLAGLAALPGRPAAAHRRHQRCPRPGARWPERTAVHRADPFGTGHAHPLAAAHGARPGQARRAAARPGPQGGHQHRESPTAQPQHARWRRGRTGPPAWLFRRAPGLAGSATGLFELRAVRHPPDHLGRAGLGRYRAADGLHRRSLHLAGKTRESPQPRLDRYRRAPEPAGPGRCAGVGGAAGVPAGHRHRRTADAVRLQPVDVRQPV